MTKKMIIYGGCLLVSLAVTTCLLIVMGDLPRYWMIYTFFASALGDVVFFILLVVEVIKKSK
jgi:hypothetical protein